jgi:hypothetical protein
MDKTINRNNGSWKSALWIMDSRKNTQEKRMQKVNPVINLLFRGYISNKFLIAPHHSYFRAQGNNTFTYQYNTLKFHINLKVFVQFSIKKNSV